MNTPLLLEWLTKTTSVITVSVGAFPGGHTILKFSPSVVAHTCKPSEGNLEDRGRQISGAH